MRVREVGREREERERGREERREKQTGGLEIDTLHQALNGMNNAHLPHMGSLISFILNPQIQMLISSGEVHLEIKLNHMLGPSAPVKLTHKTMIARFFKRSLEIWIFI
jgi:hypothetical protein